MVYTFGAQTPTIMVLGPFGVRGGGVLVGVTAGSMESMVEDRMQEPSEASGLYPKGPKYQ